MYNNTYNKGKKTMYCTKCGTEIVNDEAVVCIKCGCSIEQKLEKSIEVDEPKTGIGVVFGLFLGLIGLLIGICLYKEGTIARKTFIKSWVISYVSTIVATILICVIFVIIFVSAFSSAVISETSSMFLI